MSFKYQISETYKRLTKQAAINFLRLKWGARDPGAVSVDKVESVVILAQERYGDLIVMTPLLRELRQLLPNAEITVLGVTEIINFLKPDNNLNVVCNIKHAGRQTKTEIFSRTFDLLINTKDHPSVTFLKLTGRIRAKHKVGIYHERHHGFFNHMIELDDALPTVEKNISFIHYLRNKTGDINLRPYLPEGQVADGIKEFVTRLAGKSVTGINLNASNRTKEWGVQRWREFLKNTQEDTIILSTADYMAEKQSLENEFAHVIASPSTATIFDVGHLVKHMRILVTPDTSLVHVAACHDTPVVALYRLHRDLQKFKPLSRLNRVSVTPTGVIDDISPQTVLGLYHSVLDELTPPSPAKSS